MKRLKYIGATVLFFGIIISVLLYNKSKTEAKSKITVNEVYYVTVDRVTKQKLNESVSFVGTITAQNDVNIISETQGKVTGVFAKVGDYRQAGSVLIQIDDELKKSAYTLAEANYNKAKKDYERFQALFAHGSATDVQLEQMKVALLNAENQYILARRQYNDTKITAPISGVITSRLVDIGTMVTPGMQIANIVDISRLKVKVNVSESDAFRLKAGDLVEIETDVYPGVQFGGRVEWISSKGDDAHTFPVEISVVNNSKHSLKSGMFARINFKSLKKDEILVVPRTAIVGSVKEAKVFVLENGLAKLRNIVTGVESGTSVEVLSGLTENEVIVVSGQSTLVDNAKVTVLK